MSSKTLIILTSRCPGTQDEYNLIELIRNHRGDLQLDITCGHCDQPFSLSEDDGLLYLGKEIAFQIQKREQPKPSFFVVAKGLPGDWIADDEWVWCGMMALNKEEVRTRSEIAGKTWTQLEQEGHKVWKVSEA